MVVIVFGLPGSGKSYFASRLAGKLNALYLNTDQVRLEMFTSRSYSEQEKKAVYGRVLELANTSIDRQENVVIDGTFYKSGIRNLFMQQLRSTPFFIEVQTDEATIHERLKKPRTYSEADFDVYLKVRAQWEPFAGEHLVLQSTNNNIEEMLAEAIVYLGKM